MSKKEAEILQKMRMLGGSKILPEFAVVKSVNKTDFTAEIIIDDLVYTCGLNAFQKTFKGFVQVPTVGSSVLATRIDEDGNRYALISCTELDTVYIKGGVKGESLINITELTTQLNKLTARVDAIISILNNAAPTAAGDGGTSLMAVIKTALQGMPTKESFTNIEDDTILKKY